MRGRFVRIIAKIHNNEYLFKKFKKMENIFLILTYFFDII